MRTLFAHAQIMQPGAPSFFIPSLLRPSCFPRLLAAILGMVPLSWTLAATVNIPSGSTLTFNVPAGPDRVEPTTTFTGGGTLLKTGAGQLRWGRNQAATFALGTGSLINIQGGTIKGGDFGDENWTNNFSGLNVAAGAKFDGVEARVRVDALTGAGRVSSGYTPSYGASITFGVGGGSGNFSGTLANYVDPGNKTYVGHFIKAGAGTQTLSGIIANSYTGTMTVNGGTLALAKSAGNAVSGSSVTLNTGGTLLLQRSNQIADAAAMTLLGGTFSTGAGANEVLGTLTLSSNSTISLGASVHNLTFGASNLAAWSPTATLMISGWSGTGGLPGTQGRIFFGNNAASLTSSQLAKVTFQNYSPGAQLLASGELVPMAVPETETLLAALCLASLVAWRERRHLAGWIRFAQG